MEKSHYHTKFMGYAAVFVACLLLASCGDFSTESSTSTGAAVTTAPVAGQGLPPTSNILARTTVDPYCSPTPTGSPIYYYPPTTPTVVSKNSQGEMSNNPCHSITLSWDGRYTGFTVSDYTNAHPHNIVPGFPYVGADHVLRRDNVTSSVLALNDPNSLPFAYAYKGYLSDTGCTAALHGDSGPPPQSYIVAPSVGVEALITNSIAESEVMCYTGRYALVHDYFNTVIRKDVITGSEWTVGANNGTALTKRVEGASLSEDGSRVLFYSWDPAHGIASGKVGLVICYVPWNYYYTIDNDVEPPSNTWSAIVKATMSRDGSMVAFNDSNGALKVFSANFLNTSSLGTLKESPAFSEDGKYLVYRDKAPVSNLHVRELSTGADQVVYTGLNLQWSNPSTAISGDGKTIAWNSASGPNPVGTYTDQIFVMRNPFE